MLKVLVIDDEALLRKGIVLEIDWLSIGCMVVAQAANGMEGIEATHKYQPDLIITDIRMPKMDGIQMVKQLREEGNEVSVIFLTAYSDFSYAQSAIKLYVADYLLKPFEDGELEAAVLQVIKKLEEKQQKEASTDKDLGLLLKKGDKSKYVMEAIDYIAKHYSDEHLCIATVAQSLGVSEGHLSHIFKKETEFTIMSYITQYRMHIAMKLLSDCRYKVYEVTELVGYHDCAYFSSTFKKVVGVSPSEYQDRSIR
ncbi:response regulator transcription factor [Anaerosporobacter faecicola]|uniref:response regulator transcription factor n=1 Tax=Anaerosporobacter faecicola TaxID=2718714 RepID=UPI0014392C11|nr:response regulator [Anaerosporobacter faecicola]